MLRVFAVTCIALAVGTTSAWAQYSITVLHNNDGESALLPDDPVGGIARFATLVDDTRTFFSGEGHGVVTIYAGDSFLPSPEFQASLNSGDAGSRTFYDALALSQIGYDAAAIGNHEFDAGPDVLAEFISDAQSTSPLPFLSSNLDFTGESSLNGLVGSSIFKSTTVAVSTGAGTKTVGIIGATTENLPFLSSSGATGVSDVATAVNAEIAALSGSVDHMILVSHLQGINEDLSLLPNLSPGLDLIVAGGGDEILANVTAPANPVGAPSSVATTGLLGADTTDQSDYPNATAMDSGGNIVPVVTGAGDYKYLGRATLNFDATGELTSVDMSSNPIANQLASLTPDPAIQTSVVEPVQAFVDGLAETKLATSSQRLIGNGDRDVIRATEAGLGNLVADAFHAAGSSLSADFNVNAPDFAIANGGGIRDDVEIGDITLATTFDISPFGNIVSLVEDISRDDIALIFENAYSKTMDGPEPGIDAIRAPVDGTGRFLHVSEGVEVIYDITATPMELDRDGNVLSNGDRILSLVINGETIVADGEVIPGDSLNMVVVDFLANGGDQTFGSHLSKSYDFTRLGITDQNALASYLGDISGGDITFDIASDFRYDAIPDGRISPVPEPEGLGLAWVGFVLFLVSRNRR